MYVCFECWLMRKGNLSRLFFLVLFSIFSTIFLDTWRMSRHFWHSSRVEKILTSTWKKNARLNFISACQHSQQTYINSYFIIENAKKYRKCPALNYQNWLWLWLWFFLPQYKIPQVAKWALAGFFAVLLKAFGPSKKFFKSFQSTELGFVGLNL